MTRLLLVTLLFVLACGGTGGADERAEPDGGDEQTAAAPSDVAGELGTVDFRASCAPAVQEDFDAAVALLHHMMYEEAQTAFEAITRRDPGCAMAHWGVAMTLFHPLWPGRPDVAARERGWQAVQRARELEPGTERERLLLTAAEAFFREPEADEWWPRIRRWAGSMESAYEARPDDDEIAAFHGLAILAAGQTADDQLARNARAADVLAEVYQRKPLHPGAIHYTIHADDATGRADEHLDVVARYGEIAPSVPHALHMPSHIYVRLGDWPEVIEWNDRSADAALDHSTGASVSFHHAHALDYQLYGFLQQGADGRAEAVLDEALSTGPYQESFASAFHMAVMPARFALERRDWEAAARLEPGQPGHLAWDRYTWPQALTWFARGMGAVMTEDTATASAAETRLEELRDRSEAAGEPAFATYIEVDRLILAGRIAWARGQYDAAVARLREAAELARTVEKHPVTPGALLPPHEALGDLLVELGREADAVVAYEASLAVWPRRYRSILGAARAAAAVGDEQKARQHYETLLDVARETSSRPGVREARAMVAGV